MTEYGEGAEENSLKLCEKKSKVKIRAHRETWILVTPVYMINIRILVSKTAALNSYT